MNANEAPKKIYLQDSISTDTIGELWPEWLDTKVSDNSIEYTRTDVLIDRAADGYKAALNDVVKWLNDNIYNYVSWNTEEYEIYVNKIELCNNLTYQLMHNKESMKG